MSSTALITSDGVVGVTQVYPPHRPQKVQLLCLGTKSLDKGYPLVLGTVQIMIGIIVFLLDFPMVILLPGSGIMTGVFLWGAGLYIISGVLTVAAGKSLNRCLVNVTLRFNMLASLAAVIAVVLYSLDARGLLSDCWLYQGCGPPSSYDQYRTLSRGFSGILAVFHALEFVVSLTVSQQKSVYFNSGNAAMAAQAPPPHYTVPGE